MLHKPATLVLIAAALAACAKTHVQTAAGTVAPAVTPANNRMLPEGAELIVKTDRELGEKEHVGEEFYATVTENLVAKNGQIAVPEGAKVYGHITALREKHGDDPAVIKLNFDRLEVNGKSRAFHASVVSVETPSTSNETLKKAAIGAVAGGALGAIITGGAFGGIATGGAIGAAAGTLVSLGMDHEHELPEGTRMTLRTTEEVRLR
jgi:osmotically inducible lipoprotein OsmB